MWFSFFKAEAHAHTIYSMLLPKIIEEKKETDVTFENGEKPGENQRTVSAVKLMQFIDLFNYYPLNTAKLRKNNDSSALAHMIIS